MLCLLLNYGRCCASGSCWEPVGRNHSSTSPREIAAPNRQPDSIQGCHRGSEGVSRHQHPGASPLTSDSTKEPTSIPKTSLNPPALHLIHLAIHRPSQLRPIPRAHPHNPSNHRHPHRLPGTHTLILLRQAHRLFQTVRRQKAHLKEIVQILAH